MSLNNSGENHTNNLLILSKILIQEGKSILWKHSWVTGVVNIFHDGKACGRNVCKTEGSLATAKLCKFYSGSWKGEMGRGKKKKNHWRQSKEGKHCTEPLWFRPSSVRKNSKSHWTAKPKIFFISKGTTFTSDSMQYGVQTMKFLILFRKLYPCWSNPRSDPRSSARPAEAPSALQDTAARCLRQQLIPQY